jgi:serine/threonine protein kinase/TRAP-type C4-dicarboxylate transport system substrate-binding protein
MDNDSLLARLADEFTAKVRTGKSPDVELYARRYPRLAARIRELFPTLIMLEGIAERRPGAAGALWPPGLSSGSIFGPYRIEREIGRGGMGIVYEAIHIFRQKQVALKVLMLQAPADAGQLERFFREARNAAALNHPHLIPVLDVGQVESTAYFAMQYIDGRGLDHILRVMQSAASPSPDRVFDLTEQALATLSQTQRTSLSADHISETAGRIRARVPARFDEYLQWVSNIGIQAAEGLAHAHERRLIHRDIKPSNLLLDKRGVLWIADFGLARRVEDPALTISGILLGTPRYMSPEQADAARRPIDHRSDIYSLGATLYELLTCRPVFEGKNPQEVLLKILEKQPVAPRCLNPDIPAELEAVVLKAMARRPEDRYQSANELRDDLRRWADRKPVKARPVGRMQSVVHWYRRNSRFVAVAATTAAIVLLVSAVFFAMMFRDRLQVHPADGKPPSVMPPGQAGSQAPALVAGEPVSLPPPIPQTAARGGTAVPAATPPGPSENQDQAPSKRGLAQLPNQTVGNISGNVPTASLSRQTTASGRSTSPLNQMLPNLYANMTSIRLATLAATGSFHYLALQEMAQKWREATGGLLRITIYPNGTQGGEANMVRLMRSGSLTAGTLSVVGLSEIEPAVGSLSFLPMAYRSWDEYDFVLGKLGGGLEKMLQDKGFVVLFWADAGWVRFFSKTPAFRPEDFKSSKIFTWAGNEFQVNLMKSLGYHPVPLETDDILPGLRTGLINAVPLPSCQALAGQVYTAAPNMLNLKWSVLSGATVIRRDAWDRFQPDLQTRLFEAAAEAGAKIRAASRKEDENAIKTMQTRGLIVHSVTPGIEEEWRNWAESLYPLIRGTLIPAEIFDSILPLLAEYRDREESNH